MKHETAVLVGSGGMGEVFKAWDPDLERHIAFKYLKHDDPVLVERLLREARAQARIDHPSVCKVYEVGDDDGRPYIAMEYVDGEPLDAAVTGLTLEQKILLLKEITEAVQAAHAAGLVHRDLKPGNILVADHGDHLHPYVVDFGIAHFEEMEGLTMTGQVMGTPGYVSPEQARGDLAAVDRRTDVFSLGIILYELLGGAKPFDGDSNVEILVSLIEQDPKPLRRLAPHLPKDLETVVMTCLEKDPERRYPSAKALADDLGRFLDGEPVSARPVGFVETLTRRSRKHPKTTVAAIAALLAIAVFAGLALNERRTAAHRAEIAQGFGREIERMDGLLERAYLLPLHDTRSDREQVRQRMALIDAQLEDLDNGSQALGHYVIGRGHLALGEASRAQQRLQRAWELGDRSPELNHALGLSLAELYRRAVNDAAQNRNDQQRETALERAGTEFREPALLHLEQSRGGTEHPAYLDAVLSSISDNHEAALASLGQLEQENPFFYQGILLAGIIHREDFVAASRAGSTAKAEAAFDRSQTAFKAASRIGESDPAPYKELCGLWVNELRNRLWASGGDLEPARDAAIEACDKSLIADPDSAAAHIEAGRIHRFWAVSELDNGRHDDQSLAAVQTHAQAAIASAPDNAVAHVLLGLSHRIAARFLSDRGEDPSNQLELAVDAYREAIRLDPADSSAPMSLASALLYLGDHKRNQGEDPIAFFTEAAEVAELAIQLEPEALGSYVNAGIAHSQIGILARDRGEDAQSHFDRGAAALERAIEINPGYLTAHFNLGEMLLEAAMAELRSGLDPTNKIDRSLELLETAANGWPTWAPPRYLQAEGLALLAEHHRLTDRDPTGHLGSAYQAIAKGTAINPNDATGLSRSSLAYLVDGRWRSQREIDPSPAVAEGLAAVDEAIKANPNLASAYVRRTELLLIRAEWKLKLGSPTADDIDEAEIALAKATEINPNDTLIPTLEATARRIEEQLETPRPTS